MFGFVKHLRPLPLSPFWPLVVRFAAASFPDVLPRTTPERGAFWRPGRPLAPPGPNHLHRDLSVYVPRKHDLALLPRS